jgi:glutamine synthetase
MRSKEQLLNELADVNKVKVAITDIDGILRGKYMHGEKFRSALSDGFGFCSVVLGWDSSDVCYDNANYTGWHTGYPDAQVELDPTTFRRVPWDNEVPFLLGDFFDQEQNPLEICPRQTLKRIIAKGKSLGFEAKIGSEFEWFNFSETPASLQEKGFRNLQHLTPGMFGYSLLRSAMEGDYFNAIMDSLGSFGIPLEGLHTETGPGVYEAALMATEALEAADRAVLFKSSVKELAYGYGVVASFMARWNEDLPGCSGHLHQSLWQGDTNVFFDEGSKLKLSTTGQQYLAGILHCLPDLLVMFAPTVNSYKRLVEGFWAPTKVSWAVDNRTAAVRYIHGSPKSTRFEFRTSGADMNPYLSIAACLAAGLYGIENKLELKHEPIEGSAYKDEQAVKLAPDLKSATELFENSSLAKQLLGDKFVEHYAATRHWEWRQSQTAVTDWELKRYFEII